MRVYYIRKTGEILTKYEIYHKFKDKDSFDGYALTKLGAKYRVVKLIVEDFIKYDT